ncbi:MAG TPA: tetratricopeptide repeat-containing sensor histidine kinase [Prolixibacteraceae bacterium]|nr:tetratricopeptide repeat-containing sensor histidine kinase [Prolixibacteraceae bacterium]
MRKILTYKLTLFGILFFLIFVTTLAQNSEQSQIDSLHSRNLIEKDKKEQVSNYNQIAYFFGGFNTDSSLFYSQKAMALANEIKYNQGLAIAHSYTARGLVEKSQFKLALENYVFALNLFITEKDSINILDCYRGMSYVASFGASQLKSLDYNLKALNLAEILKDTGSLSIIYNNIGTIYKRLDNYDLALTYFGKSLALKETKSNLGDLAISYSNVGVLKVEKEKFKEAEADYQKILELLPKINNEYVLPYLYLSLSGYYNGISNFALSKMYIDKASTLCAKNGYSHIQARLYRRQAEMLLKQKRFQESIQFFDKCLQLSKSIGVNEEFPEIYKLKAEAYSSIGNLQEAYKSLKMANISNDSLKSSKVAGFLEEFEIQNRENELEQKKLEQALKDQQFENTSIRMKNRFEFAILAIVLLIVLMVIVLYFLLKIKKNNEILFSQNKIIQDQKTQLETNVMKLQEREDNLRTLNATKDKFFSIIAHDLKSPFNSLLGFNEMLIDEIQHKNYASVEKYANHIDLVLNQSYALLTNLLDWSLDKTGGMKFCREKIILNDLLTEVSDYFSKIAPNITITTDVGAAGNLEIFADRNMLKSVIRNLMSNAIKYTPDKGSIKIIVSSIRKETKISIVDTGIGIKAEAINKLFRLEESVSTIGLHNEKGTGLGLLLCKDFVEKHKGRIWVESEPGKGSSFSFTIPTA